MIRGQTTGKYNKKQQHLNEDEKKRKLK